MRLKRLNIILPLLFALFLVGGMLIGNQMNKISAHKDFQLYPRGNKLSGVLDYITSEYVDSVSSFDLIENSIPEILKQLDPHSLYIPAADLASYNEPLEGNFFGIGVQFNMQEDTVYILNTIVNGPSEKVGILAGDRIISVDDSTVAGVNLSSTEIVSMLKGKKGTRVRVDIIRRGVNEPIEFEISRDKIPITSVDLGYMLTDEIAYIKISNFSKTTYDEFLEAVARLKEEGMQKLVVDLRSNGGGFMSAATNIADHFLAAGKLIVYTEGNAQPRQNVYSTDRGELLENDIIVLIDEGSASASEILAGALQDNDRGLILGRRSFGKGLVQQQTMFTDGSALRLTIARYYTPTGRSIQKPYSNGLDEYFHDLSDRFSRGEMIFADSIKFADSLKYITPGGNIVYGGGGIMPDIFIPYDTTLFTSYFNRVSNRGLIYRFAFQYADNNRQTLSGFKDHRDLSAYLDTRELLGEFVEFAEGNGVKAETEEIILAQRTLNVFMKAYIGRIILDSEGYYPIIHEIDREVLKSIEILSQS